MSNGLDPDQARRYIRPDLCSSCLQKLSADEGKIFNGKTIVVTVHSEFDYFNWSNRFYQCGYHCEISVIKSS